MYLIKPAPLMIKTQLIVSIRHGSKLTAELRIADCKFCEDQKRFLPHTDRLRNQLVTQWLIMFSALIMIHT